MNSSQHRPSCGTALSRTVLSVLPAALILLGAGACLGQGFGPDPFRPYNSQFDPFVYPVAPGPFDYGYNLGSPANGVRGANQFENYLNSLRGAGSNFRTGSGAGVPYYRANRAYDEKYDRIYRPNREVDERFETNQKMVTDLYFQYLREKDPKRRAELYRELNRARVRADRELAAPRAGSRSASRANRREPAAPEAEPGTSTEGGAGPAPPIAAEGGAAPRSSAARRPRAGEREGATPRSSAASRPDSSSPPPIDPLEERRGASRGTTPSRVLDRALRTESSRSRVSPRPRATAPGRLTPPPIP